MLQATDVWFGYDAKSPVVRGVTLAVPATQIVGILGPNGSGKTTLLRMLAGTRQPQRGSVTLDGAPLTRFTRTALARRASADRPSFRRGRKGGIGHRLSPAR